MFGTGSGFWFPIWAEVFGFGARSFGIGVDLFGYGSKRWDWGSRGSGIRADLFGLGSFVGICIELTQFGMIFFDTHLIGPIILIGHLF